MEIELSNFQEPIESIKQVQKLFDLDISELNELILVLDMAFVKPFSMCFIANSIKFYIKSRIHIYPDLKIKIRYNSCQNGCSYAANMGFFKFISEFIDVGNLPGELQGNSYYLPLTIDSFSETHKVEGVFLEAGAVCEVIAKRISKVLVQNNDKLEELYSYLLRELIRNIPEHANSDTMGYSAQYWPKIHCAEICVFDYGCGIYKSLKSNSNYSQYIIDNKSAIDLALKPGISEKFSNNRKNRDKSEWANSGYGLYFISEICHRLSGSLLILSKGNYMYQSADGKKQWGDAFFDGTIIRISLPVVRDFDFNKLLQCIRYDAEKKSKEIDNAYQNASKSSMSSSLGF